MSTVVECFMPELTTNILIEGVEPEIDEGRNPVKRIAGEPLVVEADILKEGHDDIAAVLKWRQISPQQTPWSEVPFELLGNDRFRAQVTLQKLGRYALTIEAWPDQFSTWAGDLQRKLQVRNDLKPELMEGALMLQAAANHGSANTDDAARLVSAHRLLAGGPSEAAFSIAQDRSLMDLVRRYSNRLGRANYREFEVLIERPRALFGTWYEFFPRSTAKVSGQHGTFRDAEAFLPQVAGMGFDVAYLPPIHPIGRTARKGKNNSLRAQSDEPGSPWAIGSSDGGHKSIHPQLGTLDDFKRFLAAASRQNLEVALDIAFQCSPDHPYVKEHPSWFHRWPDGTLKTAENPPKRYEDIVHFNFESSDQKSLWEELKSIVLFWCEVGVRIFRVDNPHTKPLPFWRWLLREVQSTYPDAVFLSEAFTRPKMMKALAKQGFTQSYTYFTWRNSKAELEDYLFELTHSPTAEFMRGNLWPNTPDILPQVLQLGGPAAFRFRYALAATLSPSCGIFSGYEFCEARPLPAKEEYADSEKYQLNHLGVPRRYDIRDYISKINRIRRDHPALQAYRNLMFCRCDNQRIIFYARLRAEDQLLIAVSLDPFSPQQANLEIPHRELGTNPKVPLEALDLLTRTPALWQGPTASVQLTPEAPAAIWQIQRIDRTEASFEYYY